MPDFPLSAVPGLEGTLSIPDQSSGTPVAIALKDPVLFLPGTQRLNVSASHQRSSSNIHTVTLAGTFASPVRFLAGQIELTQLTLVLRFREGAQGTMIFDPALANAATATGTASWTGASVLGLSQPVALNLSYRLTPPGFTLALANPPLALPGNFAQVTTAEVGVDVYPDRNVFAITLRGQASLSSAGQSQANALLRQVFPSAPAIQPAGFALRQEFALAAGSIPATPSPVGLPRIDLDFNWTSQTRPSPSNVPSTLAVDIGVPRFSLPLGPGANWQLHLPNCSLRFPAIPALHSFRLDGNLQLESNRLLFSPASTGGFQLPDVLGVFLSRLSWIGGAAPLDQVASSAASSPAEVEWRDLFRNLLPDPIPSTGIDLAALSSQLFDLISSALSSAGLEIERVFLNVFQGLEGGGKPAHKLAWEHFFGPSLGIATPMVRLPNLLLTLHGLSPASFEDCIAALLETGVGLQQLTDSVLKSWALAFDTSFAAYHDMFTGLFASVIGRSPSATLTSFSTAFSGSIFNLPELQPHATLPPLPSLPGFTLPSMPKGQIIFASTMEALTLSVPAVPSWKQLGDAVKKKINDVIHIFIASPADREKVLDTVSGKAFEGANWDWEALWAFLKNALKTRPYVWWDLIAKPVNAASGRNIRYFPQGKYLILSDAHRDRTSDKRPPLEAGGISHFAKNRALFLKILDWADSRGYTLLEAGDGEELWYIRDRGDDKQPDPAGRSGTPKVLADIIASNSAVYDKLRKLHYDRRYFRLYGNHDSFLRHDDVFPILKKVMEEPIPPGKTKLDFQIYDFFQIDGIKKMTEHSIFDKFLLALDPGRSFESLFAGVVGMDANDYQEATQMLVTHGHQFDFWNNDNNNALGILLSQVGVAVNKRLDPFLDSRGLSFEGVPFFDFRFFLANLPVANCWPAEIAARRLAHEIQHDQKRRVVDNSFYWESMPSLWGSFGIAIDAVKNPNFDPAVDPNNSNNRIDPGTTLSNDGIKKYLELHHNHHICIGHTHNPHSQPFYRVQNLVALLPVIGKIIAKIWDLLKSIPFFGHLIPEDIFKTKYLNSGTAGWMEGVVWGILIDDRNQPPLPGKVAALSQARLVYWTYKSAEPETMDWELDPLPTEVKAALRKKLPEILAELQEAIGKILSDFPELAFEVAFHLAFPLEAILIDIVQNQFDEGSSLFDALKDDIETTAEKIQGGMLRLMAIFLSRFLRVRKNNFDILRFRIPLPPLDVTRISHYRDKARSEEPELGEGYALHVGCVGAPFMDTLAAEKLPVFGNLQAGLDAPPSEVLSFFSPFIAQFPYRGSEVTVQNNVITTKLQLDEARGILDFAVIIRTANTPEPSVEPIDSDLPIV